MLNSLFKYKWLFLPISLTGCMSSSYYVDYKSECYNLPFNFDSEYFKENYDLEKTVYVLENYLTSSPKSYKYILLGKNDRWENVQINLNNNDGVLKEGFYSLYRDYKFENCITENKILKHNAFKNQKGNFCIAAQPIDKITAHVKFINRSTGVNKMPLSTISHYNTKVYYKEQLFLETDRIKYKDTERNEMCRHEDNVYKQILKDFY